MAQQFRIGDVERSEAVEGLKEHYIAGRLTQEEFDERTTLAWKARTSADLRPLFVDLPKDAKPERERLLAYAPRSTHAKLRAMRIWLVVLAVLWVVLLANSVQW